MTDMFFSSKSSYSRTSCKSGSSPNFTLAAKSSACKAFFSASTAKCETSSARRITSRSDATAIFCFFAFSTSLLAAFNSSVNLIRAASDLLFKSSSLFFAFIFNSSTSCVCRSIFDSRKVSIPINLSWRSSRSSLTCSVISRALARLSTKFSLTTIFAFIFAKVACISSFECPSSKVCHLALSRAACISASSLPVVSTTLPTTF
mmetsp:Transcript_97345/g.313675  ORF Transcript_97345/g.313675 Transcript_97345/m.313675 type:complete len:204 (+) Transcript_97345:2013-2624(+)